LWQLLCFGKCEEPRILHYHLGYTRACGGIDHYIITLCKLLQEKGYFVCIATNESTIFKKQLVEKSGILYYKVPKYNVKSPHSVKKLKHDLIRICKFHKINIINCHRENLCNVISNVAKKLGIKSVYFDHHYRYLSSTGNTEKCDRHFKQLSAFFGSCKENVEFMTQENNAHHLGIEKVLKFTPFSDLRRISRFLPPIESKHLFFLKNFLIDIDDYVPAIAMIANMSPNKNHLLLFDAVHKLIYRDKIPIQVLLAGDGNAYRDTLEQQVKKMNLEKFVFFLGYTNLVPEIMHYSDVLVLVSFKESCGLVIFEAALSRLPVILSKTTEVAGSLICHEKTGLLVDPNNSEDLVKQLKRIIFDKILRETIIKNAHDLTLTEYMPEKLIEPVEKCYIEMASMTKIK
jgi:glycosyltransferase involved in cell wall biosynthesis